MDSIDTLVEELNPDERDRFVAAAISEILSRNEGLRDAIGVVLSRVGWALSGTEPYPLRLHINLEITSVAEPARVGLERCLKRYRDGDTSGAMTAICGIVDDLTERIYTRYDLDNHRNDSYQERVVKAFLQLSNRLRDQMLGAGLSAEEANRILGNYRSAISGAAYVLGAFRREFSDVHGPTEVPTALVQRALDCAIFIVGCFSEDVELA